MPAPGTYKEETMMVINTKWKRGHLKFVGIRKTTKDPYKVMIQKFFNYLSAENIALPTDLNELDYHASEFVTYLWQFGDSLGYAHDFASGMSRFFPRAKKHLAITRSYLHNWGTYYSSGPGATAYRKDRASHGGCPDSPRTV